MCRYNPVRTAMRATLSGSAADQKMLFNEAEVLAAIEAAEEAHRERTTKVEAHERKRSPDSGRKAIPEHFPRIVIEHDLACQCFESGLFRIQAARGHGSCRYRVAR
jgi:hypothetical protein